MATPSAAMKSRMKPSSAKREENEIRLQAVDLPVPGHRGPGGRRRHIAVAQAEGGDPLAHRFRRSARGIRPDRKAHPARFHGRLVRAVPADEANDMVEPEGRRGTG